MADSKIKIQLRAKVPDENLTLEDFSRLVSDFNTALAGVDQHVSTRNKSTVAYRVVDLKHSSPAEITLEATGLEDSLEDNSGRVFPAFIKVIEELNAGRGFDILPRAVLEPIYRIAKSISETIKEIRITGSRSVIVTERISVLLAEVLENERITVGAVRGVIDIINVHKGTNTFRIYPIIGPSYVTCWFPTELKEKAKAAIEKYVRVGGKLHYRTGSEHPHLIDVEEIEIMPDESTLPTLASLKGIVKLDKSTEETLEEERNGQWE